MKKFYIEESGYYKLRMEIEAVDEDEALSDILGQLDDLRRN